MTKKIYILIERPDIESFRLVRAFTTKKDLNKYLKIREIKLNVGSFDFFQVEEIVLEINKK